MFGPFRAYGPSADMATRMEWSRYAAEAMGSLLANPLASRELARDVEGNNGGQDFAAHVAGQAGVFADMLMNQANARETGGAFSCGVPFHSPVPPSQRAEGRTEDIVMTPSPLVYTRRSPTKPENQDPGKKPADKSSHRKLGEDDYRAFHGATVDMSPRQRVLKAVKSGLLPDEFTVYQVHNFLVRCGRGSTSVHTVRRALIDLLQSNKLSRDWHGKTAVFRVVKQ